MKKRRVAVCVLLTAFSLLVTGCGMQMTSLTDEEEELIALYSAKMVSKYNVNQDKGVCLAVAEEEPDPEVPDDAPEEEPQQEPEGVSSDPGGAVTDPIPQVSLSEALGVEGVTFTYQGFDIREDYQSTAYFMTPNAGYSYLILNIQAHNNLPQDAAVDLLSKGATYRVNVNGGVTAMAEMTILLNDLATYQGSLPPGGTQDLVLLFQVKTEQLNDVSSIALALTMKANGTTSDIAL